MRTHAYSRRWMLTSPLLALAANKGFAEEPKPEVPSYNHISDEEEIKLGREAADGFEKDKKLKFIETPAIQDYANRVLERIAKSSRRPNLPYKVKIVDTKEINACALPGGFVYLNRGLMEWAGTESEMAGVLSHEIGHVVGHHGTNAISRYDSTDSLLAEASNALFGDDRPARILKIVGGPVAFVALLRYSREQEFEADLLGYYNMQRAGWDANGMLELFKHLGRNSSQFAPLLSIASTHPAASDREYQIKEEMKSSPPLTGMTRDSTQFEDIKLRLKSMPKPQVTERLVAG